MLMLGSKLLILHISTMARVGSAVNIEAQKIIRQADNPQSGNVFASVSPEGRTEIDSELRSQDVNLHAHSTAAEDVVAKSTTPLVRPLVQEPGGELQCLGKMGQRH